MKLQGFKSFNHREHREHRGKKELDFGKITETRFFGFICHLTYAPATLRRRLKNLVSGGSPPPFSAFAKLQKRKMFFSAFSAPLR